MSPIMSAHISQSAIAAVAGVVAHWGFFVHGEIDLAAARIAGFHLFATAFMTIMKYHFYSLNQQDAFLQTIKLAAVYAGSLFTSILLYRLLLSPLHHIPGPINLRLTKLTHVWIQFWYRNCEVLEKLHQQYGDVVRTGPNEVTLFGTEAFYQVHGKGSICGRAAYYDLLHPMVSLDTTRDPVAHDYKRKIWDQAFSFRALERLETVIYDKADLLVKQLRNQKEKPVDISTWFGWYTFDLMGEFGLTIPFNNLESAKSHPIYALYTVAHKLLGPFAAAPWIKHLLMGIPYIERMKYYREFMEWAAQELDRNIRDVAPERTDIIGYVINDAKRNGGVKAHWNHVLGDFVLVIAAGSDPMRQVLSNLMYHVLCHPDQLVQIRAELATIDIRNYKQLQQLPHLTACIYETLRLDPAVPSAGLRMAPPGGLIVAGEFIPAGTTIAVPQYSLFRDEHHFTRPSEWIPERFSTRPDLILDKQAFVPWSTGRYACLGKNLSLMEIRVAAALVFTNFEFEFGPGEDGRRMFSEATDFFTTTPGPMQLVMRDRQL